MADTDTIQIPQQPENIVNVNDTATPVDTQNQSTGNQLQQPNQQVAPITNSGQSQPQAQGAPQQPGRHNIFRDIFETLAGPAFKYQIDPNTGQQTRMPVQRTKKQLADSIVAGALTGLFAGASEHGPGRDLRAFAKGGQATMAMKQQQKEEAQNMSKEDYARKASIADTNLRTYYLTKQIANMDYDFQKKMADTNTDLIKEYTDNVPGAQFVYDDDPEFLKKANVTKDNAMLAGVEPKYNADGSQAKGPNGELQFRHKFLVVDPNATATINEELLKDLQDKQFPGIVNSDGKPINLPSDPKVRLGVLLNMKSKSDLLTVTLGQYSAKQKSSSKTDGTNTEEKPKPQLVSYGNPDIEGILDQTADKYGVPKEVVRALAKVESNGNPSAVSPKGAQGVMQLMPTTAKSLGVNNPLDPKENIDGGVRYLKQLMDKNGGDPKAALAAYHGKGSDNITTDQQYVDKIMGMAGSQGTPNQEQTAKPTSLEVIDKDTLNQMLRSDPVGTVNALTKFAGTPGGHADEKWAAMANNPATVNDAAKIARLFGGPDAMEAIKNQRLAETKKIEANATLESKEKEIDYKEQKDREAEEEQRRFLDVPDNFNIDPEIMNMSAPDAKKKLIENHVKVPANFDALWKIAHNEATLKTLPQNPRKGTFTMDAQTGLSYINQFINPAYHEGDFESGQNLKKEFASTKPGTAGANLLAAGTAANHLGLLSQEADKLGNMDEQTINKIANAMGVEVGKTPAVTFKAIADQVNQEVAKTVSGGTPHEAELQKLSNNLSTAQSPEQIKGVVNSYLSLMNGRINEIGNRYEQYFGKDESMFKSKVSPQAARFLGQNGDYVPGYGNLVSKKDEKGNVMYGWKNGNKVTPIN